MKPGGIVEKLRTLPGLVFGDRKIIVISGQGVSNFPISARFQWAGVIFVVGFLSWASYSTGTYITYQSVLTRKDRQLTVVSSENRRMEEHFNLLKHDLMRVTNDPAGMAGYKSYILSQYHDAPSPSVQRIIAEAPKITEDATSDTLLQRIAFLESKLAEVHGQKDSMVQAIRKTTRGKITELEKIVSSTTLELEALRREGPLAARPATPEPVNSVDAEDAEDSPVQDSVDPSKQGGPFLPVDNLNLGPSDIALFEEVQELTQLHDIVSAIPLRSPMKNATTTSPFGRREDPITGRWAFHSGLDFSGKLHSRALSTAPGVVTFAGRKGAYGRCVEIDHGYGLQTRYGHLWKIGVVEGDVVKAGDVVGLQGSTGRSTGDHLHYEVRFRGIPLNPRHFLNAGNKKDRKNVL